MAQMRLEMRRERETGVCAVSEAEFYRYNVEFFRTDVDTKKKAPGSVKKFAKPSVEEVEAYCRGRSNGINAQRFCDYYESRGWVVGRVPMKDWKAAVRTWERNEQERKSSATGDAQLQIKWGENERNDANPF